MWDFETDPDDQADLDWADAQAECADVLKRRGRL
jgi:hypothetical protein